MLTDAEILELETLLKERDIDMSRKRLCVLEEDTNPNYAILYNAIKDQKYEKNEKGDDFSPPISIKRKFTLVFDYFLHNCSFV